MSDARSSSDSDGPFAWRCIDGRFPFVYGIVTDRQVTVNAWREGGIEFQALYPRDVAQCSVDRDKIALDAAHQIEALPSDLRQMTRTARIQVIVLEAIASSLSSTSQKSPVMQVAENAAKVVEGWSDSKKAYADRVTGTKVTSTDRP